MSTQQEANKQAPKSKSKKQQPRKDQKLKINLSDFNTLAIEFVNSEGGQLALLEFDRELSTGKPCITIGRTTAEGMTLLQMDFPSTETLPV